MPISATALSIVFILTSGGIEPPGPSADSTVKTQTPTAGLPRVEKSTPRVAVLNFGRPPDRQGAMNDLVGVTITPQSWTNVIKLLEQDGVGTVVVRVNSRGGLSESIASFNDVLIKEFVPRFRTVAWIERAQGPAALCVYPLEELYFSPIGAMGGCFEGGGMLVEQSPPTSQILETLKMASKAANRDEAIGQAMVMGGPLSFITLADGRVVFAQTGEGLTPINEVGAVLSFSAGSAAECRFSRGSALTRETLAEAMKIDKPVWAGEAAAKAIDDAMVQNERLLKQFEDHYGDLLAALPTAETITPSSKRTQLLVSARAHLRMIKECLAKNPLIGRPKMVDEKVVMKLERRVQALGE